jgi:glycosyltransferase involved in cell wall biosynthesis
MWWWDTRILGLFRVRLKNKLSNGFHKTASPIHFDKKAAKLTAANESGITVILTAYRRVEYLEDQIASLRNQTVPPTEIWVWFNSSPDEQFDISSLVDRVIISNTNWLYWGRFALGNLARTGYVAFLDDDILPQPRWFESCLDTINSGYDGILGGSGVILPLEGAYSSKNKVGWNGRQLKQVATVDLVGHAWFMRKKHLQYIWREEPYSWDNGEDIHLSYMALKYGGVKTFVPPHPEDDRSVWSCRPDFGKIVGRKNVAVHKAKGHKNIRSQIVDTYRQHGWEITQQSSALIKKTFSGDLKKINLKLNQKENFSLVRFGDGEMVVINGESIDLSQKCNGEHKYMPGNDVDEKFRQILTNSLTFKNPHYFVGLACRCCVGDEECDQLRHQSQQDEESLTWANIFVNANYPLFLETTVAELNKRVVNIICHEKAKLDKLPIRIQKDFRVGGNAWVNNYNHAVNEISQYIVDNTIEDEVFIFCAGVLSNMLIYELTCRHPKNTYIDLGSAFDAVMGLGKTRKYLKGSKRQLKKVCVW